MTELKPTLHSSDSARSAERKAPDSTFKARRAKAVVHPRVRTNADAATGLDGLRRGRDFAAGATAADPIVLKDAPGGHRIRSAAVDRGERVRGDMSNSGDALFQLASYGRHPKIIRGSRKLQCVPFARDASGVEIFGNANRWWELARGKYSRTLRPEIGAVLVMNGYRTTRRGHVAVVKEIIDDRTIVVDHANWLNDGKIYLNAPVQDVSNDGDWSRVRVWYTPGQQWGKRVYTARGFILPVSRVASTY